MLTEHGSRPGMDWHAVANYQIDQHITVFRIRISQFQQADAALRAVLHPDEIGRAAAYHQLADRHRFVTTRAVLRLLIGKYTGMLPTEIYFRRGPQHKPELAAPGSGLRFNVSHAGDWALLALSALEVGVDVEKIVPDFDFQPIAHQVFTAAERAALAGSSQPTEAFFRAWTRKEALVKATGQGLGEGFSPIPATAGWRYHPDVANRPARWAITSFAVQAGYVGALAYPVGANAPKVLFCEFDTALLPT